MRQTLRRSCDSCAKSKHSCDLRTPRCSRCVKRKTLCVYANEPLTAQPPPPPPGPPSTATPGPGPDGHRRRHGPGGELAAYRLGSLDPFDSYPQTRLPREHVQRLIHSFLHKIAFQYYPLDLNATSNPFLVSWWPLALGDPALFHVSLQTACLDEELLAQKGFQASEILMADSVALLRRKVHDTSLALQDGTMNSVITLAAIEFGKGNIKVSEMHVDGVTRLVNMRGGINAVRQTSPLTARMVGWVSMIVKGHPQFDTQDDDGIGYGIPPIPEWQMDMNAVHEDLFDVGDLDMDDGVRNVFTRLRNVFQRARRISFPTTRLHDLTCFVIHRLLLSAPDPTDQSSSPIGECVRYAMALYMFIVHGPTYYSHAVILSTMVARLAAQLARLDEVPRVYSSLDVWIHAVGMVAAAGTPRYQWFAERAWAVASAMQLSCWDDVAPHVKSVLWLEMPQGEDVFMPHWTAILDPEAEVEVSSYMTPVSKSVTPVGFM
ncbi:C6 zinc finger domain-containing protein [Colletotrichum sojae]|uniref:C6 zinc finger domain-containing protein n=1 Tax=Colletotrichum sojae TaxID=2175907 RepID=A0A8H6J5N5_9PEZI|nr:C6 zinc finger domain-containing protein [Colletotrichum sojae]